MGKAYATSHSRTDESWLIVRSQRQGELLQRVVDKLSAT
jgi:hypothetical protein